MLNAENRTWHIIKKFSIYYYYYYYHQLPSIIWNICGIGYLANALILEVSIVSDSHYHKQYHNQDYSLCFNITTSFYYLLLPNIWKCTKNSTHICSCGLTSTRCGRLIKVSGSMERQGDQDHPGRKPAVLPRFGPRNHPTNLYEISIQCQALGWTLQEKKDI